MLLGFASLATLVFVWRRENRLKTIEHDVVVVARLFENCNHRLCIEQLASITNSINQSINQSVSLFVHKTVKYEQQVECHSEQDPQGCMSTYSDRLIASLQLPT